MRRSISSITVRNTRQGNTAIGDFLIASSGQFKRTTDTDAAGHFEKIEVTGYAKEDMREALRACNYCAVTVSFDHGSPLSFGSSDYPATLILEETEGRTSFKITYERPL